MLRELYLKSLKRNIFSLTVYFAVRLFFLFYSEIQNDYLGGLNFENGLPITTKKDRRNHGYGMKSIRYTAEKYNGTITVQVKNHIFMLWILIPLEIGSSV